MSSPFIDTWLHRIGWSGFIAACGFVIRFLFKGGQWFSKTGTTIEDTHRLVQTATTNHLSHIETGITQLSATMSAGFDRMESALNRVGESVERASDRSAADSRETRQAIKGD